MMALNFGVDAAVLAVASRALPPRFSGWQETLLALQRAWQVLLGAGFAHWLTAPVYAAAGLLALVSLSLALATNKTSRRHAVYLPFLAVALVAGLFPTGAAARK